MSATPHTTEAVDPRLAIVQDFAARVRRHDPAAVVLYRCSEPGELEIRTFTDRYHDEQTVAAIALELQEVIAGHQEYLFNYRVRPRAERPLVSGSGYSAA